MRGYHAIPQYATAVQSYLYPEGREFRLVLYPTTPDDSNRSYPRFQEFILHDRYRKYPRRIIDWARRRPNVGWPTWWQQRAGTPRRRLGSRRGSAGQSSTPRAAEAVHTTFYRTARRPARRLKPVAAHHGL